MNSVAASLYKTLHTLYMSMCVCVCLLEYGLVKFVAFTLMPAEILVTLLLILLFCVAGEQKDVDKWSVLQAAVI
jgi:hypothetical protein